MVNLRQFLSCRLRCHGSKSEDLSLRLLRHGGIYQSDVGPYLHPSPGWSNGLRPVNSNPNLRTRREDHVLPIVSMSSGRRMAKMVPMTQASKPGKTRRGKPPRGSGWDRNFDLKKAPKAWPAAEAPGHRQEEAP